MDKCQNILLQKNYITIHAYLKYIFIFCSVKCTSNSRSVNRLDWWALRNTVGNYIHK